MTAVIESLTEPEDKMLMRANSTLRTQSLPLAVLALAVSPALAGARALLAQEAPPPASSPAASAAPASARPYQEIIKLWKGKLSEEFIKARIDKGDVVYDLNADEIIQCRDAGLPESLIQVMMDTTKRGAKPAAAPAPAAPAPDAGAPAPAPAAATAPAASAAPVVAVPAAPASAVAVPPSPADVSKRWEGLARRNSGIVLKNRWDVGVLELKEETVRWMDARDAAKNLLVPAKQMKEQSLTCLKKPGGNECFEWVFRTEDGTYRFRDVSWEHGENKKVQEIYDFFQKTYPALVSSSVPVDEKKK